ncbi:unnamed protein product [Diamesa serratosioi]
MDKSFKIYKSKENPPDLNNVIDCTTKDEKLLLSIKCDSKIPNIGLQPVVEWKIYKFNSRPGLILIKNPFTGLGQKYWIRKLLKSYTKYPNPNNLLPDQFNENERYDFWTSINEGGDDKRKKVVKKAMRWSTLGYHYNWTDKVYNEEIKNEFPNELGKLISTIAEVLGFKNYKSEAAIVNFYPLGSTLAPHTDHSEFFLKSPLFSISFGQSAIFLIGGQTREEEPLALFLNSGDVLIMSEESRLCYHSVPRVFKNLNKNSWNTDIENASLCSDLNYNELEECKNENTWMHYDEYLIDSRINVNVRQVNE